MNSDLNLETTRREFLRSVWRRAALVGLAAGGVYLQRTRRTPSTGTACVRVGECAGCALFNGCGLPTAVALRQARPGSSL